MDDPVLGVLREILAELKKINKKLTPVASFAEKEDIYRYGESPRTDARRVRIVAARRP